MNRPMLRCRFPRRALLVRNDTVDGTNGEDVGAFRISADQLATAATSSDHLVSLADPDGGVLKLELIVSTYEVTPRRKVLQMPATAGLDVVPEVEVMAGQVIGIRASSPGGYCVGPWLHALLHPRATRMGLRTASR
jgi:hypothetical protein